ncbi:Vi polysaccharide biosynthesis protein TviA [Pantoea ananatis]|uniref:Vi polysaccharide biosynthesis protein TviA n=1 Tax=Pantoea ananas TaxID=553 RepID=UPI001FF08AB2|nr:Vi polysaccharide biosynthesis protein TviA [Pantoea ananatis]
MIDRLALKTNERNYFFVNLNAYSLPHSFNFFSQETESRKNIVLISSHRLDPLAEFWLSEVDNIIAAFTCSHIPDEIIEKLSRRKMGEKINGIKNRTKDKVNRKDVIKMRYFLHDSGMQELTQRFISSPSTVYRWRRMISDKFGVKEPRYLLIP